MKKLASMWWLLALRGIFGILIGIAAIVWPGLTLQFFIILFGIYILVEGIITTIISLASIGKNQHWFVMLLEGVLGIIIGWILFAHPMAIIITFPFFVWIFAIWMILSGFIRIILAIAVRKEVKDEFFMMLGALLSIIVGVILVAQPIDGVIALIWIFGFYAILFGILLVAFAFKVKGK